MISNNAARYHNNVIATFDVDTVAENGPSKVTYPNSKPLGQLYSYANSSRSSASNSSSIPEGGRGGGEAFPSSP